MQRVGETAGAKPGQLYAQLKFMSDLRWKFQFSIRMSSPLGISLDYNCMLHFLCVLLSHSWHSQLPG